MAKEKLFGQNILFDKISKEVVKIKTKTPNNFKQKGQTLLDCLTHFDTRSGPNPDTYKEFAKLCPLAVTEGVEVTVALPEKKKAKRKAFDVEAYVRREIQKARRENQELLHKAHFLCMLGHLRYLSGKISTSKITLGCALSVVPKVSEG